MCSYADPILVFFSVILFYQIDWLKATNSSNESHLSKIDYKPESTVSKRREKLPERRKKLPERISIVQEITHIRGIDALQNYCNSPMKETVGQEGKCTLISHVVHKSRCAHVRSRCIVCLFTLLVLSGNFILGDNFFINNKNNNNMLVIYAFNNATF
jgi:hypothetical protein